jgi:hypothetical protein
VVKIRQAALDVRPAMRDVYLAVRDPLLLYGLPTSQVADMGSHFAIRLQRAVIQEWKEAVPWAKAGQATVANGGEIAREAGLWPPAALVPVEPPVGVRPVPAPAVPGVRITPGIWVGPLLNPLPSRIALEVSADGTELIGLVIAFEVPPSAGCDLDLVVVSVESLVEQHRPIEDGQFGGWVTNELDGEIVMGITGQFTSATTVIGTYEFYELPLTNADGSLCGTVTGAGLWEAEPFP